MPLPDRTWIAALAAPLLLALASLPTGPRPPAHFPPLPAPPPDNAPTEARVELGRLLFFEPALSVDSSISCGSCHKPHLAFADSLPVSPGVQGRLATRNAPSLQNLAYRPSILRDGGVPTLEMQVLVPVQEHAEMDFNLLAIAERLQQSPRYRHLAQVAYQRPPDPFVVTRALAAYQRSLISGSSRYDFSQGAKAVRALSKAERRGLELFRAKGCTGCHSGPLLSDQRLHHNGLKASYPDSGRARVTHLPQDVGLFITPPLRNLALTAPYMHDGSLPSLEAVLDHYAAGGKGHPNQDSLIRPFSLSRAERRDLLHFLRHTLADPAFIASHADDATRPLPPNLLPPSP